ncbi:hypothetical protein [Catellatospora sp. TT07R-123]|uniref:hypothetical protein n=1 Tax=Catellatospora sp. TT07R-123 TaxID=2733863 RepID=UPI001FD3C87C|nr:hypothetical protein [Catellatospora sp. TT07R-123]
MAPPRRPDGYEIRFASKDAAEGWEELARVAPNALRAAWEAIDLDPQTPVNVDRHHRLKAGFAHVTVKGVTMEQWQYEVTSGGRIWFGVDRGARLVWITYASTRHPKETD